MVRIFSLRLTVDARMLLASLAVVPRGCRSDFGCPNIFEVKSKRADLLLSSPHLLGTPRMVDSLETVSWTCTTRAWCLSWASIATAKVFG